MRYTPEQKEQALTLSRQPGATAGSVSRQMGIPARAIQRWIAADAKQKAAPDNVTSLMEQRERARQMLEETPSAKIRQLRNQFTEQQFTLLQRHATDLTALRSRQLKAVLDNDPQMTRTLLILSILTLLITSLYLWNSKKTSETVKALSHQTQIKQQQVTISISFPFS